LIYPALPAPPCGGGIAGTWAATLPDASAIGIAAVARAKPLRFNPGLPFMGGLPSTMSLLFVGVLAWPKKRATLLIRDKKMGAS
jgi:hypothetical protein